MITTPVTSYDVMQRTYSLGIPQITIKKSETLVRVHVHIFSNFNRVSK